MNITIAKTESIGVCPFDPTRVGVAIFLDGAIDARWKMAFWQEVAAPAGWDDLFDPLGQPANAFDALGLDEGKVVVWVAEGESERAIERMKAHVARANDRAEKLAWSPPGARLIAGILPEKSADKGGNE